MFLYKRAQIFVGDVWGCFGGSGLGGFGDSIAGLTMFADYRVPVVLRGMGVLHYSEALGVALELGVTVPAGSAPELEIRACTIQAVERLKRALGGRIAAGGGVLEVEGGSDWGGLTSVAIDWFLWNEGETARDASPPHHKTLTVYY